MIVNLCSVEYVKAFAKIITESGKSVVATSGGYRVDASSVMGLFSLDLTKPITLEFPDDCKDLKEKLSRFAVTP